MHRVIELHVAAPAKPAPGAPCNGCGVCCALEPCPLGVLASRRVHGACAALAWDDAESRYRCALVVRPQQGLPQVLRAAAPLVARLARRWIAAGAGCDCDAQARA
jgi:hypothetical protein